ncbi:kinase-like domain-containing protein [Annulohypoxylon moriforme]|nr:kinase-like domain-containing protein [Annulohypoxylon moriforme]
MKYVADISHDELRDNYINIPRDHFWIEGPNGRHLCLISELLGPSLYMNYPDGMDIHTPESLTDLTSQVSKGLQFLHQKGICHGDLRPSNILMQLNAYNVMELSGRQINKYLGPLQHMPLETLSGKDPKPHGPDYLVFPASLEKLQKKCRTKRVAIVDFTGSFFSSDPPALPKWNRQYAAPELLFTKTMSGYPQDIWALACTIYEVKVRTPLFSEYQNYTSLIQEMEVWFGPLPAVYRQLAITYLKEDKEQQQTLRGTKRPSGSTQTSLEERLPNTDEPISLSPEEEQNMRKMSIGKSDWLNPLQASLGRERDCAVYERNDEAYTSSDDTQSDTDGFDSEGEEWFSEGDDVQEDIYAQADLIFDGIEEDNLGPEDVEGDIRRNSNSPVSQTADTFENQSGQTHKEKSLAIPTTLAEGNEESGGSSSETESATSEMILRELLAKRDADESSEDRDTKRQRMNEDLPKKRGEWVKRVVSMPKEEVLLLSDLLSRMFKHDPKERINIDDVINHDFWGDRRYNQPTNPNNFIEEIPDPISTRTRSHASKVEKQTGPEPEPEPS